MSRKYIPERGDVVLDKMVNFRNRLLRPIAIPLGFFLILILFILLNKLFPLPVEKLQSKPSKVVLDRNGELMRVFLAPDEMWRIPISSNNISPILKQAVLSFEDKYFYWHPGINPISILRAAVANIRAGKIVQGGSTITMQLTRMMEPKERTFSNKLIETFRSLQLEWQFSKEEILICYLNMAPYGGNRVGIASAAYLYFKKRPEQFSIGEAALLAAIPNSPNHHRPDLNPKAAKKIRDKVVRLLASQKKITQTQAYEALSEPLPKKRHAFPFLIPHLSTKLSAKYPEISKFVTTIDKNIQIKAERILKTHLQALHSQGISNGAVVIIENESQEVLAMVGSVDFFDGKNQGQVNGAMAPRSPGSALKPFVYALAMEHGLISPKKLVHDVPVEYSGYRPINYDDSFNGAVTVEEALIRSLNVPAVNLYAQLGENGIYSFLQDAGISTLPKDKDYYGLSLILGGCEVTLLELTNLYSGLANGGRFRKVRLLKSEEEIVGTSLLTSGTSYIITEILSKLRRPELPAVWDASTSIPKVAWKTGTSYGHRDAWSIGYTPEYTIGVWVGNFDGRGVPALVGADAAAPILFALANALPTSNRWFTQPDEVEQRQVCSTSGMPVNQFCATVKSETYLPGISPNQLCEIHQLILVDKQTGQRLCSHCRQGKKYEERIVEQWPAEIATWLSRHGSPIQSIPEHFRKCSKVARGEGPIIQSPVANSEYKIRKSVDLKYQKILLDAAVTNQTQKIHWFVNNRLLSSVTPNEKIFLKPKRGTHSIICMDDQGRSAEVTITIK